MITVSQEYQREAHRSLILDEIRKRGAVSRAELSRITSLKRPTVSNIIHELLPTGIISEVSSGESTPSGGRRPVLLQINNEVRYIIGIDLDLRDAKALLIDLTGRVVDTLVLSYRSDDPHKLIYETVKESYEYFNLCHESPVVAVGIGISGIVDQRNSSIIESRLHGIRSLNLSELFEDFPVPVLIENDANSCAGIEIFNSSSHDLFENGIFVLPRIITEKESIQSVELGGAVIVNGDIWYGSRFVTGEFSMKSWFNSPVEQVPFLQEDLKLILSSEERLKDFMKTVLIKLIPAARMLDPDRIILGGVFATRFDLFTELLEKELRSSWYDEADHDKRVRAAYSHQQSIALGAGIHILRLLYGTPRVGDTLSAVSLSWDQILTIRG